MTSDAFKYSQTVFPRALSARLYYIEAQQLTTKRKRVSNIQMNGLQQHSKPTETVRSVFGPILAWAQFFYINVAKFGQIGPV
jgi:hypothetical protein